MIGNLFDVLLALGLLWLGWRTITSTDLFRAMIFFIIFGLLMALCWARLRAPDVALAEAAIGAGMSGALLLDAYRVFRSSASQSSLRSLFNTANVALILLAGVITTGLIWTLWQTPSAPVDLNQIARDSLDQSGVSNPVTAVLLNFRAYDTLLEVAVLIMALIGVWTLGIDRTDARYSRAAAAEQSPLLDTLVRLVLPLSVVTAGYLLWSGSHAPGGAFQAGAVLAATGILLRLTEYLRPSSEPSWRIRLLAAFGCMVFLGVALEVMLHSGTFLQYPRELAGVLIFVIEAALMLSIGLTLTLLFVGSANLRRGQP